MQIIREISNLSSKVPNNHGVVLSIGNFDGVHRGHQFLLSSNRAWAQKLGCLAVAMTFDPHPVSVLKKNLEYIPLFTREDCIEQLKKLQMDFALIQSFNDSFADLSPRDFLHLIFANMKICGLVLGPDFCFGKNRQGNIALMTEFCKSRNIEVIVPPKLEVMAEIVSTSAIRNLLSQGEVAKANLFLGRPYYLKGKVISGAKRGQKLGFPTANMECAQGHNLKKGVYLSRVEFVGEAGSPAAYNSITNIGSNPTFETQTPTLKIETHLFDFSGNIYGKEMRLELLDYLRNEKKFSSGQELREQINRDLQTARERFK